MFQFEYKRWIGGVVLFPLLLLFISAGTIRGQSSSTNYKLTKSVADQGGAASSSTNYKLVESVGQPSPVSYTTSANYKAALGFWGSVGFVEINIYIPNDLTCGCYVNDTFAAPVIVEDVTGKGIFSYGLDVLYDAAHLDVVSVISTGTISSGWGTPTATKTTGKVSIAGAGATALSSSGNLVIINFKSVTTHTDGQYVNLDMQNVLFNEGTPSANVTDGKVTFNCIADLKISGTISYYMSSAAAINNVQIDLAGDATQTTNTNASGYYEFANLTSGNYSVSASKARSSSKESSISAFDASYILRHYVNDPALTLSEAQKIAADASGDGTISTYDASIILRYYVEQDVTSFDVANWTFVVPPVTNWLSPTTSRSYAPLSSDQANQNFDGILIGDVTGNFSGSMLSKAGDGTVVPGEMKSLTNNMLELPVRIEGVSAYSAVGFELKINKQQLKVEKVSLAREGENVLLAFHEQNGTLRVAVASAGELKDTNLLTLTFKQISKTNLNDVKIRLMGYEIDAKRVDSPQDWLVAVEKLPAQFDLKQNYPNPFNPETSIQFDIAKPVLVNVGIYNLSGQLVSTLISEKRQPGSYLVKWDASDFPSGVYFYRIKAGDFIKIRKMILIK